MKKLTFGQVMDTLKLDEVAVKIGKPPVESLHGMKLNKSGLQYDTNDRNILKTLDGNSVIIFKFFIDEQEQKSEYFIMKKDLYFALQDKFKGIDVKFESESDAEFDFVCGEDKEVFHAKLVEKGNEMQYHITWEDRANESWGKRGTMYSVEHVNKLLKDEGWIKL